MSTEWDHLFEEQERRESRKERKRAAATDRSKYKKSNIDRRDKQQPKEDTSKGEKGRVVATTGLGIEVAIGEERLQCVLRGLLKKEAGRTRRLVAVGDEVLIERTTPGEGVIHKILPRRTVLTRADPVHTRRQHILAVNIDQVLITSSVVSPPLKPGLIDRYIIAAEKGGMEPIVVINKIDLLQPHSEEAALLEELREEYRKLNIRCLAVSATTGQGMGELREVMRGSSSLFSGQSGTGKSSLINEILGLSLEVGEVVTATRKGAHTTTTARLLPIAGEGWCIDSPGIKSFGMWELEAGDIEGFFREIAEVGQECRYPNCTHTCEPDCAVLEALEEGRLSTIRYNSYLALIESAQRDPSRRKPRT